MQSADDIAAGILDFSDAEFASAPALDLGAREDRLLEAEFIGIAINAKRQIDVGREKALPVAVAVHSDSARSWDLPLRTSCLLVACSVERGLVLAAPGLLSAKQLESRDGGAARRKRKRPSADELDGEGAEIRWTDLAARMEIPWEAGAWTISAVYFDWVSNSVPVTLVGGQAPSAANAPLDIDPPPTMQVGETPTFRRHDQTPPAPASGLSFEVALEVRGGEQQLRVSGVFRTVARPYSLVPDTEVADTGTPVHVAAVVPMTLLVAGTDCRDSWTVDLVVPVYGPTAQVQQPLEGCFTLDALAAGQVPELEPGNYACYVILDGVIHGPRSVSV